MKLWSDAFQDGEAVPVRYTADGDDVSPPLRWSGAPDTTVEFALICDDPDAPTAEPWVHWIIYGIPVVTDRLDERLAQTTRPMKGSDLRQGRNSWTRGKTIGYRGPAPPPGHGTHHYHFRLYALDSKLRLDDSADRASLVEAMRNHVAAEAETIGTYRR